MAKGAQETDPLVATVSDSWELGLVVGVITLGLGLLIAFHPTTSLNVICVFIGILVILGGLFSLVRSLNRGDNHRVMSAVLGIVMIVVGVILIRHLDLSRLLVALVVAVIFIVQGVVDLLIGFSGEAREGRVWRVIIGLVSLAAGIVVLAVPENSVTVLATLVGIWFAILGALQIIVAFVLRHELKSAGSPSS